MFAFLEDIMKWDSYFKMMIDWKKLPAYKAEPRIDSLIGFYLKDILSDFCETNMAGIIPEFPIRLGTIDSKHEGTTYADRSYKVDFYLISTSGENYFVEFKTDSSSRRDKQDWYLSVAKDKGMQKIVEGVVKIASVSSYKKKYNHLLSKLKQLTLLNDNKEYVGISNNINIIYVQPNENDKKNEVVVTFDWISKWLNIKHKNNEFVKNFSSALAYWADD
jgi:hypothetical protein